MNGETTAVFQWFDATGDSLYIGGQFDAAGSGARTKGLAMWNGQRWLPLGGGIAWDANASSDVYVQQFCAYDDGAGQALYICGRFGLCDGAPTPSIAKWDGVTLRPLPGGFTHTLNPPSMTSMVVFDEGSGPCLYLGGVYRFINGVFTCGIAKWDGSAWSPVGDAFGASPPPEPAFYFGVYGLAVFNSGDGPDLYAVASAPGVGRGLYRLRAGHWSLVPGSPPDMTVSAGACLAAVDSGPARGLYVCTWPTQIHRFDGATWAVLPPGLVNSRPSIMQALATDPPTLGVSRSGGSQIYVAPELWNGAAWINPGTIVPYSSRVHGFAFTPAGETNTLAVVTQDDDEFGPYLELRSSDGNTPLVEPGLGSLLPIRALARVPNDPASPLYALRAFSFDAYHGLAANLGAGFVDLPDLPGAYGHALTTLATRDGERLIAAGRLYPRPSPDGVSGAALAIYDGASWTPLGALESDAPNSSAHTVTTFDAGAGPDLIVGGSFDSLDGAPLANIARYDGAAWLPLGPGAGGPVHALAVHDDGSGPAIYAGGEFTPIPGMPGYGLARWDGHAWSSLPGFQGNVAALAVARENGHEVLYVSGNILRFNGAPLGRLAKYDHGVWSRSPLSLPSYTVAPALVAVGDGPTQHVIVSGPTPIYIGATPLGSVAIYDGVRWSGIAGDIDGPVTSILIDDNPAGGVRLTLAGDFTRVNNIASTNFARIDLCSLACPADTNADRLINMADLNNLLDQYGYEAPTPEFVLPADLNADGIVDFIDLNILLGAFGQAC